MIVLYWSHRFFKTNIRWALKIKLFVAHKIQYIELEIFPFNSYVYYLTRGFIASTRAFNLLTSAFNLPALAFRLATRAFNLATRAFKVLTRGFKHLNRGFELATRRFELETRRSELVTCGFELVTRNSCFTFPLWILFSIRERRFYVFCKCCKRTHELLPCHHSEGFFNKSFCFDF